MSFRVMVIPEDFRKDQYIVVPILANLVKNAIGKDSTEISPCTNPRLGGVVQALDSDVITEIVDRYRAKYDLFIHCVDGNGIPHDRRTSQQNVLTRVKTALHIGSAKTIVGVVAEREAEAWVLAGLSGFRAPAGWNAVRQDPHVKDTYYLPEAGKRGVIEQLAEGRKTLGAEAARNCKTRIRTMCPELQDLEDEIRVWYGNRP